jgi:hypothetical protein
MISTNDDHMSSTALLSEGKGKKMCVGFEKRVHRAATFDTTCDTHDRHRISAKTTRIAGRTTLMR